MEPSVSVAMSDVLPSDDALDAPTFEAVEYINAKFASERALTQLEPFVKEVAAQIAGLDDEISRAVHAQAEAGAHAKIGAIKLKADESESIVREICRDVKSLDYAKKNLQTTMTALKRMHMLTTAIRQLRTTSAKRDYGDAANLLEAVGHLLKYFEPYGAVPRVADLRTEVEELRETIEGEVFEAFEALGHLTATVADAENRVSKNHPSSSKGGKSGGGGFANLAEACVVVDALGAAVRERQVSALCKRQLEPYGHLFPRGGETSGLDGVERRFAWIRRLLRTFGEKYGDAFPQAWRVEKRLVVLFVEQTRAMFLDILGSGDPDAENVTVVLKALQKSLVFEKEVQARFDDEYYGGRASARPPPREGHEQVRLMPKPQRFSREESSSSAAAAARDGDSEDDSEDDLQDGRGQEEDASVLGALSSVFDPFMGPYVALERKNLEEMMRKVSAEEQVDRDGALPVFSSSAHMFAYIKTSVKRCTALTTGQTFYKLHLAFCDCLRDYAQRLKAKLEANTMTTTTTGAPNSHYHHSHPPGGGGDPLFAATTSGGGGGGGANTASSPFSSTTQEVVEAVCYALNTAEYCAETVQPLAGIVRERIDPAYADKIDLEAEEELFHDVIALAVKKLVAVFEGALEPALRTLVATNWGAVEVVDDESAYVRQMIAALRECAPKARDLLSAFYFRNLCDKFVASFLPKFHAKLSHLKRINEMGTHQLLLDVHSLKPILLGLPCLKAGPATEAPIDATLPTAPNAFLKFVNLHVSKLEMLLKLVGTPTEMLVERFKIMWPDGGEQELATVIALKGITKRAEQQHLLDLFGGAMSAYKPEPPELMKRDSRSALETFQDSAPAKSLIGATADLGSKFVNATKNLNVGRTMGDRFSNFSGGLVADRANKSVTPPPPKKSPPPPP